MEWKNSGSHPRQTVLNHFKPCYYTNIIALHAASGALLHSTFLLLCYFGALTSWTFSIQALLGNIGFQHSGFAGKQGASNDGFKSKLSAFAGRKHVFGRSLYFLLSFCFLFKDGFVSNTFINLPVVAVI